MSCGNSMFNILRSWKLPFKAASLFFILTAGEPLLSFKPLLMSVTLTPAGLHVLIVVKWFLLVILFHFSKD